MVAAGLFGALHNQLSFSVGSSYFYDVKFTQFGINPDIPPRLGAAQVGWMASWWMGLFMALPAMLIGLMRAPGPRRYFRLGLELIGLAMCITLLGSFCGLSLAYITDLNALVARLPNLDAFSDPVGFARAGLMHEGTYIGGAVGGLTAAILMWRRTRS